MKQIPIKQLKKMTANKLIASNMQSRGVYKRIHEIINSARGNIVHTINKEMVAAYWKIGHEIVEEEQRGHIFKQNRDYRNNPKITKIITEMFYGA